MPKKKSSSKSYNCNGRITIELTVRVTATSEIEAEERAIEEIEKDVMIASGCEVEITYDIDEITEEK